MRACSHFFTLCRAWGLRSDIWRHLRQAREESPEPESPPPPLPQHAQGQLALSSPQPLPLLPHAAALAVSRDLAPHLAAFAVLFDAPSMLAACCAEPHAPISTLDMSITVGVRDLGSRMRVMLLAQARQLQAAAAALVAAGEEEAPAWRLGTRAPPLAESGVQLLLLMTHAMVSSYNDAQQHLPVIVRRPLSAPEAAHCADHIASGDALHGVITRAQSALLQLRHGGGGAYLEAGAAVLAHIAALLGTVEVASQVRIDRFAARLQRGPRDYRQTFFKHAHALGVLSDSSPQISELAAA